MRRLSLPSLLPQVSGTSDAGHGACEREDEELGKPVGERYGGWSHLSSMQRQMLDIRITMGPSLRNLQSPYLPGESA